MKGKVIKSAIVQMIGYLSTMGAILGFHPLAVGLFIAVWCSRLIRFPLFPIIVVGIGINTGLLTAAKYGLVLFTIVIVFYILEGKKSRVAVITGSLLGAGVMYVMELTDIYMSGLGKEAMIMATLSAILTVSASIVFYKVIEMLQLPRGKGKLEDSNEGYKEMLSSYEERVNSISDAFAKMARNIEKNIDLEPEADEEVAVDEDCDCCRALKRKNIIYKNKLRESRRVIATQLLEMSKILGESVDDTYDLHGISKEQMSMLVSRFRDVGVVLKRAVRLDNRRGISEIIVTMKARKGTCVSVKEITKIISLVFDKDVQIVKGIKQGDTVIISGTLQLRMGLPVVLDNIY